MKQYFLIAIVSLGIYDNVNAQTVIEQQTTTSVSALLNFKTGTTNGLILPAVQALPTTPANGTFLFDRNDSKVKMRQNGVWVDLSATGNSSTLVGYSGTVENNKKTVIGATESTADGVLVLESTNKALVLPHVANPHLTVKSPYPGMMCYDTNRKALAVFDGNVWNYWK
ncbi:hypothetical protein GV828_00015 [Flavobacterium sp. NST-5]|uniref:Uncharacterized protein n=1 Tax=Flavobacterium ichthyis TaxID=2698827 RepID=A0ABW9Z5Q2_9FLAO|nr:hypothetical protein [Flavobacterium ichthyis]NBL63581.1 hypothetical protein [Flavobacterium ichthyis]